MGREFTKKCKECKKEFSYVLTSWDQEPPSFCNDKCEEMWEKREKENLVKKRIKECIPQKYRNLQTDRKNLIPECMNTNLYIYGGCGTGKSIFIANLAIQYLMSGISIEWIETLDFFQKMRIAYSNNSSIENLVQDYCYFRGVLFINDFGTSNQDFIKMHILTMLDAREKNELLTVITSNLKLDKVKQQFGERIFSRIVGMNHRLTNEKQIKKTIYCFDGIDRRFSPEKWNNKKW